jgi:hypothetical protein
MRGQGDQGDLGDQGETLRAVAAGAAIRRRRRRLTLAPAAENRFSLLQATPEENDADEIGEEDHIVFRVAEEAIEDYPSRLSSPVVRRPTKSDEELLAEFWADAGFPSPSSRFWERRSSPYSAAPGKVSNGASMCRSAPSSSSVVARRVARRGGSSSLASPMGLCLARPPRVGSWRGPLPRLRVSPLLILGFFLDEALAAHASTSSGAASSSTSTETAPEPAAATAAGIAEEGVIVAGSSARTFLHADHGPVWGIGDVDVPVGWAHLRRRRRRGHRKPYGRVYLPVTSSSSPASRTSPSPSSRTAPASSSSPRMPSSPSAASLGVPPLPPRTEPSSPWSQGRRSYLDVPSVPPMADPRPLVSASPGAAAGGGALVAPRPAAARPPQPPLSQPPGGAVQPQGFLQPFFSLPSLAWSFFLLTRQPIKILTILLFCFLFR